MDLIFDIFRYILVVPMTNVLVAIARLFGGNFGLAIVVFTIVMRLVTWPLTSSQYKQSRAMQELQPRLAELQKKHKGKDPKKLQQETLGLYKEAGVNPLGCLLPFLVQIPIWIALYQVISTSLGEAPESLVTLSQTLYPIPYVRDSVPLDTDFLLWNLGKQDPLLLPVVVAVTTYVQQKMITPAPSPTASKQQLQQQQTQQMMTWMMPLMFFFFSSTVPSGLALYWLVTNVVGIITQYFYLGRRVDWRNLLAFGPQTPAPQAARAKAPAARGSVAPAKPSAPSNDQERDAAQPTDIASARRPAEERRRKRHGKRRGKR